MGAGEGGDPPQLVEVEMIFVEIDREGGRARQVKQCLCNLSAGDGLVAAVRLGIRLLQQTHPQLRVGSARKGEPRVEDVLRPASILCARKPIVNQDCLPLAVEEKTQVVAAGSVACCVFEQLCDEIMPLCVWTCASGMRPLAANTSSPHRPTPAARCASDRCAKSSSSFAAAIVRMSSVLVSRRT